MRLGSHPWLLVLATGVLVGRAATAGAQPAPVPPPPPPPAAASAQVLAGLLSHVKEITAEVSRVRGLPVKHAVAYDVVDRAELKRRLIAQADKEQSHAETAAAGLSAQRWGLLPKGTDLEALLVELLTEQIAGYYDPATKRLSVSESAGENPDWAEIVLVHEIDHALQDQSFDLEAFQKLPDDEGDAALARHALVEGDGVVVMYEVILARKGAAPPWTDSTFVDGIVKAMETPTPGLLDAAPQAVREALLFPYQSGFAFVVALRRRQPWSAVDAAFKRAPRSTEQIIHPERYLADERPIAITVGPLTALPPDQYRRVEATVWGEFGFATFLRSHGVDASIAAQAAEGWGGDREVTYQRIGDARAVAAVAVDRSQWDSEADAIEAKEALDQAFDRTLGAPAIERTDTRVTWFAPDGTVTWIERRGPDLVVVTGAPAWAGAALAAELWTASGPTPKPTKPTKPRKR